MMATLRRRKYLLDGEPISASGLIDAAASVDAAFAADWLKSTAAAAAILRANDQKVEENLEQS